MKVISFEIPTIFELEKCASVDDYRDYLKTIMIGKNRIYATDGHVAISIYIDKIPKQFWYSAIPADVYKKARLESKKQKINSVTISLVKEDFRCNSTVYATMEDYNANRKRIETFITVSIKNIFLYAKNEPVVLNAVHFNVEKLMHLYLGFGLKETKAFSTYTESAHGLTLRLHHPTKAIEVRLPSNLVLIDFPDIKMDKSLALLMPMKNADLKTPAQTKEERERKNLEKKNATKTY